MIKIESKDNKIVKYVYKLRNNKFIKEEGKFIVEGNHLFNMMNLNDIDFVITSNKKYLSESYKCYLVTNEIIEKLSQYKSFSDIIIVSKIKEKKVSLEIDNYLYLNNIQDPGNLGTILRNSLSFNFKNIIIDNYYEAFNFKAVQSSQGAIFKLNLIKGNFELLSYLKSNKYTLYGTFLDKDSLFLDSISLKKKKVIVFGNEGNGIDDSIRLISDYKIKIKMSDEIDSLNVGVASGILLYELFTK